jgi:hypothetical protein
MAGAVGGRRCGLRMDRAIRVLQRGLPFAVAALPHRTSGETRTMSLSLAKPPKRRSENNSREGILPCSRRPHGDEPWGISSPAIRALTANADVVGIDNVGRFSLDRVDQRWGHQSSLADFAADIGRQRGHARDSTCGRSLGNDAIGLARQGRFGGNRLTEAQQRQSQTTAPCRC